MASVFPVISKISNCYADHHAKSSINKLMIYCILPWPIVLFPSQRAPLQVQQAPAKIRWAHV